MPVINPTIKDLFPTTQQMSLFPFSRTVTLWLTLLLVICGSGFLMLANGLHLNHLDLPNITAEDINLNWQHGLNLEIKHLQISPPEKMSLKQFNGKHIKKALNAFQLMQKLIPSITIHSLEYDRYRLMIKSHRQGSSHPVILTLNSDDLHMETTLSREQDDIRINLQSLSSKKFNSIANGLFLLNTKNLQLSGDLTANLAACLPIKLSIKADPESIFFQGRGIAATTTIKPLVDLFGLDDNIQPWITDYLTGSRYHLQQISGTIPRHDPAAILDTLSASIRVDDCTYSFARGLEPIRADYAEVTFSRGVLDILPHKATFYGQKGEQSRLDINFNDPDNILLTVHINTVARADGSIVTLLKYYDIRLPFLQKVGKTATDLTLVINLNTEQVQAYGTFKVGKSTFTYEGTTYRTTGGRIELQGTDIVLDSLNIGLKDFFNARISGKIQTLTEQTDLEIQVKNVQIPLQDRVLGLDPAGVPLRISYHSSPEGSHISAAHSHWLLGKTALHLDSFTAPFDFEQLSGKLPLTRLIIPSMAELSIGGKFNIKKQQADLQLILHHLQIQSLGLNQNSLALAVHYDKQLSVTAENPSKWLLAGLGITLSPFALSYDNNLLSLKNMQIYSENLFDTLVKGSYDLSRKQGKFHLKELLFSQKDSTPFLKFPDALRLTVEVNAGVTRVNLDELGLSLRSEKPGGWDVDISDMGKLLARSPLLQRLKISSGTFHLYSTSPSSPLQFSGKVSSPYALLVQNGRPQSDYVFSGGYDETGLNLVINNNFHVHYDGTISIHSKNIGYNIPAIIRFHKDGPEQERLRNNDAPDIVLRAEDGFLFFQPGSRILADSMTLTVKGNRRDLDITYGPGEIVFRMVDDSFALQGHKLNARFMNELVIDAEFENGYLTAFAEGTFDKFTAALHTDAILLKHYATLNNILAVINTLPALMTFSLPHYATNGWPVDAIRMWFDYDHGIVTIKSLELDSPEMDMRGAGTIDPVTRQVNLDINLITQAGKNMSKIPLIGYILAGEKERPTLTFHVTGDLLDPKVKSTAFEEIITTPFDMVLRTLVTPFKWMEQFFGQKQSDEAKPVQDVQGE